MDSINNLQNNAIEYNHEKNKKKNKKIIIISIVAAIIIIACVFLFYLLFNKEEKNDTRYIGKWACTEGVELNMTENTFSMIYPSSEIYGTYEIKNIEKRENGKYFTIDFNSTKRVIGDVVNTSPYTTQFDLGFSDEDNVDIINVNSNSKYTCKRKS